MQLDTSKIYTRKGPASSRALGDLAGVRVWGPAPAALDFFDTCEVVAVDLIEQALGDCSDLADFEEALESLEDSGQVDEAVDGCVPIYSHDIRQIWADLPGEKYLERAAELGYSTVDLADWEKVQTAVYYSIASDIVRLVLAEAVDGADSLAEDLEAVQA